MPGDFCTRICLAHVCTSSRLRRAEDSMFIEKRGSGSYRIHFLNIALDPGIKPRE